jgi:hypothetical protein
MPGCLCAISCDDPRVPTPPSLRVARLLLFAAAACAFAVPVFIGARAAFVSPVLFLFGAPIALFVAGHQTIPSDSMRARTFALAGAAALTALAILTGFGAGDVSFPAAGIGVLAAWSTWLHPPRRRIVVLFLAYVAVGLVVAAFRTRGFFLAPFIVGDVLLWPAILFLSPALFGLPIFAGLGIALALGAYAFRQTLPLARPALVLAAATVAGALAVGLVVALAIASPNSSARFELVPVGLAGIFAAAFATVLGLLAMRRSPLLAGLGIAAGATILTLASLSPASVSCQQNGYSTSSGPWWLGPPGSMSGSGAGGGSNGTVGGVIVRGDGTTIRFTCSGSTLSEFVIEQH